MNEENKNGAAADSTSEEKQNSQDTGKEGASAGAKANEGAQDKSEGQGEGSIDYKGELSRLTGRTQGRTELDKAIYTRSQIDKRIAELRGSSEGDDGSSGKKKDEGGSEAPEVDAIRSIIQETLAPVLKELKGGITLATVENKIANRASSAEEAQLVKYHLTNTINPSGDTDEDIENAFALANRGRLKSLLSEVHRAGNSNAAKKQPTESGQRGGNSRQPNPNSREARFAAERGLTWSESEGRYVSPARLKAQLPAKKK